MIEGDHSRKGRVADCGQASALGFGGAAIGNLYQPITDEQAHAAVAAALAAGVTYFDTAPHYGFGLGEHRLGQALGALGAQADSVVSTKVGRVLEPAGEGAARVRHGFADAWPFEPVFDYSYDGVMRSFEESRRRLGRDRIDILLAHDLGRATHGDGHAERLEQFTKGGYLAMRRLRDGGEVAAIGLGVNEWEVCEELLAQVELDVVLLAGRYTLLEQSAAQSFLPMCLARGVEVIIGGPYNSGILAQGLDSADDAGPSRHDYGPAPAEVVARVGRIAAICREAGVPLGAAALQFALAHPAVRSVIPGAASPAQVLQARAWLDTPIPQDLWAALREAGLLAQDAHTPAPAPSPAPGPASLSAGRAAA